MRNGHLTPPTPPTTRGRRIEGRLSDALEELESDMLAEGLRRNHWNKSLTARDLGISRANLVAKVRKYHLEPLSQHRGPAQTQVELSRLS